MTADLFQFTVKTIDDIRTDILRTYANGLIAIGILNPNIEPKSDMYIFATGVAQEIAVGEANGVIASDQTMPDTATGVYLQRWLAIHGLSQRAAASSAGLMTVVCNLTGGAFIAQGTQLTDTNNLRYEVSVGGLYSSTTPVPINAVDTGVATNHVHGDQLRFVNAPAFFDQIATVGSPNGVDGLTNGADAEDEENARRRLLDFMANAPSSGNWAAVAAFAEASSPAVQKCFPYPAAQGPSTLHFAVTAFPQVSGTLGATSKNRDVNAVTVANVVVPYVQGMLPTEVYVVGTTVTNQPVDVAILLALPSAPTASPPGPGGGWLDGAPWPSSVGGTAPVIVTAVTSSTVFTVNAQTPPTDTVSRIAFFDPTNWTLYLATVVSHTGSAGAYVLTIDTPMPNIATNNIIFPQSLNQQTYIAALLAAFAQMGPGEKTSNVTILQRGFRHPLPTLSWPYSLGAQQLKPIIESGDEVLDAQWIYRSATTPTVPGAITSPPNQLVPRNIGFYAA